MFQYKYVYKSGFDGNWHDADGKVSPALLNDRVLRVDVRESPTRPERPVMQYRHHFRDGREPGQWWDVQVGSRFSTTTREVSKIEFRQKPLHTDTEIIAQLRSELKTLSGATLPAASIYRAAVERILDGDF